MPEVGYAIRFSAIELMSKSIIEPPTDLAREESFGFNFLINVKGSPEQKNALVLVDIAIIWLKENKEVARFKVLCIFDIPDFDTIFTKLDNKYIIPVDLEIIIKSAALSTTRGMIASEISGTYLRGAVLPLIDLDTIIRNERKQNAEKAKAEEGK